MKYIVFTDLHLGVHNNSDIWLNSSLKLANELVDVYNKNNCKYILFLGDFFHDRQSINTKTISYALQFMNILSDNGTKIKIIIGNHDTYYKSSLLPSSLEIFQLYKNCDIIKEPLTFNNITMVPWNYDIKSQAFSSDILCGHFEVIGCKMDSYNVHSGTGENLKDFKDYKLVLSGHFHTPSINDNVRYIGSVMPFTFADVNSKRGYYLLDDETYDLDFFEFNDCPKYIIIHSNEKIDKNKIENNCIKIKYTKEKSISENEKFINDIQILNPISITADFSELEDDEEYKQIEKFNDKLPDEYTKSTDELLWEYVEKIKKPSHINILTLKHIVKTLGDS